MRLAATSGNKGFWTFGSRIPDFSLWLLFDLLV
jgi:hypothetical protein